MQEPQGNNLTAGLPSVFCRALGKDFAECPQNPRQTFFEKKNKHFCQVPEKMHSANIKTLGKFEVSGSDCRGSRSFMIILKGSYTELILY